MSSGRPHLTIDDWLQKLDLCVYRCLLKDYEAVEDILWMSERDLKEIGIKNGSHRARMMSSLTILKGKYNKMSKDDQFSTIDRSKLRASSGNSSFSSLSPVHSMSLDKPQSGVRSWPSSVTPSSYNTKLSSPRSSMEGCVTEATIDELKKALEKELSLDSSDLRSYAWYHGTILRQRAEDLVLHDGDFLVRDCISQPGDFVITCRWKNVPLHFIIKKVILQPDTLYERVQYCFEKESFDSIPDFITYYVGSKCPLSESSGAIVILQPDTLYERVQYCFEKESFDSIPDFITYYVGSKCPLSESSGAIISRPINRTMPLTYYSSRYGVQCQIHYAAKKLEQLPSDSCSPENNLEFEIPEKMFSDKSENARNSLGKPRESPTFNLTRVGSDPMLSPNTERKKVEHRPNSGNFSTEMKLVSLKSEDKPPPKPSRVPSKKCAQKPLVLKRVPALPSDDDDTDTVPENSVKIPKISAAHAAFKRQISETRFSFLDRPSVSSVSDDGSDGSLSDIPLFSIPSTNPPSLFDPQNFNSQLICHQNAPLEGNILALIKGALLSTSSKVLACHMTRMDLEVARNLQDIDLGLGVTSGLELFLLPQGQQLQKDLLERTECMKLFVAITILTTPGKEDRVQLLNKWIEIAIETKTSVGNLFGFTSVMLGLTLPEVADLQSTWLALRHAHTDSAFVFETKLRPAFKALKQASGLEAPNTCLPYILSLILILQKFKEVMDIIDNNPLETELISESILDFDIGNSNSSDFGLQLLEDHLEVGRYIIQQSPVFKQNGKITLQNNKYENLLLDMFSTELHLRMLWGFRGSVVCAEERHHKFQKVLTLLHNKCNEVHA